MTWQSAHICLSRVEISNLPQMKSVVRRAATTKLQQKANPTSIAATPTSVYCDCLSIHEVHTLTLPDIECYMCLHRSVAFLIVCDETCDHRQTHAQARPHSPGLESTFSSSRLSPVSSTDSDTVAVPAHSFCSLSLSLCLSGSIFPGVVLRSILLLACLCLCCALHTSFHCHRPNDLQNLDSRLD